MTTDAELLGRQIKKARDAKGWSQLDLAAIFTERFGRGCSDRAIQDWEAGVRQPKPSTLVNLRLLLDLEGDPTETRATWPMRVSRVADVLGDQLATLEPAELKSWRHALIVGLMAEVPRENRREEWPDDVEVIVEIVGSYLAALDGE